MEVWHWLHDYGFTLLQSVGIVGGLLFTAVSLRSEIKTRRIANLLVITENHREIWTELLKRPGLARVLDPMAKPEQSPIVLEEELFVHFLVLHLNSAYRAMKDDVFLKPDGLRLDVQRFFSLPIPSNVWQQIKSMQDDDFVVFVDACQK